MKWLTVIVFCTTLVLFSSEAVIHYNIGHRKKKFVWPSGKEMLYILGIVATFSLINSILVWKLGKL